MSEWNNTPGPWRVISSMVHVVSDNVPGSVVICRTGFTEQYGDEPAETKERWEADAHLIAAAPELAEALEAMVAEADSKFPLDVEWGNSDMRRNAIAALMKAKGER